MAKSLKIIENALLVDVVGFGGWRSCDRELLPELPFCFAAAVGIAVGATCAAVRGYGACPQGKHVKSAVLDVFYFSVPLRGRHAFSDLQ